MEEVIASYKESFGFHVLSDAERKGEAIERITGIPNFHTRTVYLTVGDHQHYELFFFYHPDSFPPDDDPSLREGFLYNVLFTNDTNKESHLVSKGQPDCFGLYGEGTEPNGDRSAFITQDPAGLRLRMVLPEESGEQKQTDLMTGQRIFPVLVVKDMERSLDYYEGTLGLTVSRKGSFSHDANNAGSWLEFREGRWAVLSAAHGVCMQLVQPSDCNVMPAAPWQMQREGFTHFAMGVKDLETFYPALLKKGVKFKSPPQNLGVGPHKGGQCIYFNTPNGVVIEFLDSPLIKKHFS